MDLKLKDKRVLITGSTKGIGYATAKLFAEEGAHVILNGRSEQSIQTAKSAIEKSVKNASVSGVICDFSKPVEVGKLIEEVKEVDILINNVGIFNPNEFLDIPDEEWQQFYDINVMSGVRLSRAFLPKMMENNWGRIIFISSESAINIPVEMIHYGMTKTAQLAISRGIAETTKGTNVTVNSVLPGPTLSNGVKEMTGIKDGKTKKEVEQEFFNTERPTSIIQRFAAPEEVASMVAYVASPLASATNGAALRVDGGVIKTI
ncbi:SDR family oxidoreductase [Marixanthomonas sp. SCSIO 43207]|uniref:SDR family NAD(P)-dependent oxidoreductase n=1 Tax=Marixanthomonas sp. SCSIO 43207 TaxID=2779360 RepID=UPI001CAA2B1A|nr:SDR family oxidoreductase [Marixanthomonas sp. SCSIO 43207]UAB82095.1 SDR family oxidoreductase [Marixanthomonas sp. SCSIO 43207]